MKAADLKTQNKPPNLLFYGPAGSGKTALVSQAYKGYMFDFDDGMRTALTLNDKFTKYRQSLTFDTYVDENPLQPTAYMNAKKKLLEIGKAISSNQWQFDACIIDSLTGLCRAAQLHVMACSGNALAQPKIQHYGMIVNEVESILTILRSFKVLTLVTAHEMLVETDTGTLIRIMSATRPHGMNKLPWLFDEVLYTKVIRRGQGKSDYIVSGRSTSAIVTRTRSGITDDIVHNEEGLQLILEKAGYKYKPFYGGEQYANS